MLDYKGNPGNQERSQSQQQHCLLSVPVIPSEHNKGVSSPDGSAHCPRQLLIGCSDRARELDLHVWFVILKLAEAEVPKVVDRVV